MRGGILLLLLVSLSIASTATAQQASDEATYEDAQKLYHARRFSDALPMFESLRDSPNARLYVARCYRELGRFPDAYEEMSTTKDEAAKRAKAEQRYAATRDAAQKELRELREKVALVQLRPAAKYKDLEIEINGRFYRNPARLKKPIPVMPGAVRV